MKPDYQFSSECRYSSKQQAAAYYYILTRSLVFMYIVFMFVSLYAVTFIKNPWFLRISR